MLIFQLKVEFFEFAVRILKLVCPRGIEPRSEALQATAMTTSAKGTKLVLHRGIEPRLPDYKTGVLPLY